MIKKKKKNYCQVWFWGDNFFFLTHRLTRICWKMVWMDYPLTPGHKWLHVAHPYHRPQHELLKLRHPDWWRVSNKLKKIIGFSFIIGCNDFLIIVYVYELAFFLGWFILKEFIYFFIFLITYSLNGVVDFLLMAVLM